MSIRARIMYFFVALVAMACFAVGAVQMAQNRWTGGFLLCLVAIILVGAGFIMRKSVLQQTRQS